MVKLATAICLLLCVELHAQKRELKGRVVDEKGKPIAGANVLIKETPNGVVTDFEGYFKISAPYGKLTLLFAYEGRKSFEQEVHNNKDFNWNLEATLIKAGTIGKSSGKFVERSE
jgi:CarboxypepD_reg-like domain